MYGTMYGTMRAKKTTIYLPDGLKKGIERVAKEEGISAADIIRDAVATALEDREAPAPRIPLVDYGLGAPDIAERVDELLGDGFGR